MAAQQEQFQPGLAVTAELEGLTHSDSSIISVRITLGFHPDIRRAILSGKPDPDGFVRIPTRQRAEVTRLYKRAAEAVVQLVRRAGQKSFWINDRHFHRLTAGRQISGLHVHDGEVLLGHGQLLNGMDGQKLAEAVRNTGLLKRSPAISVTLAPSR